MDQWNKGYGFSSMITFCIIEEFYSVFLQDLFLCQIEIDSHVIEQLNDFIYLGIDIAYGCDRDVDIKVGQFIWYVGLSTENVKEKFRRDTELKFFKPTAKPILVCCCESWILTSRQENRPEES